MNLSLSEFQSLYPDALWIEERHFANDSIYYTCTRDEFTMSYFPEGFFSKNWIYWISEGKEDWVTELEFKAAYKKYFRLKNFI